MERLRTQQKKTVTFKCSIQADCELGCLEKSSQYKDLWVIVSSNVKWTEHINYKVTKARRSFYNLKNTIAWSTPSKKRYIFTAACSLFYFTAPQSRIQIYPLLNN